MSALARNSGFPTELAQAYENLDVPPEDWGYPSGVIIAFAHALRAPAGLYVSQPLRLRKFQIEFIRDVYNPLREDGTRWRRQALLSIGRRGGKTLLAAVLVLAHLVGPMKRRNSTIVSAATTREQAALIYRYCRDMIAMNPLLQKRLKALGQNNRIVNHSDGSVYRAIAAEAGGGFGQGLDVVIYDELAQARNRKLYDMLMTSLGAQVEPLMVVISTQAPANEHIMSELVDYGAKIDAGEFEDPEFVAHVYRAPEDCALTDESAWYAANPALGDYRNIDEFRATMHRAVKVPSLEASVRNLYLNQRVAAEAPFFTPTVWQANAGAVNENLFLDGRPVYGGLDLSAKTDLTAMVLVCADDEQNVHILPFAWTPAETLMARAARDRAPYDVWLRDEYLFAPPGSSLDFDWLAEDILRLTGGMNLVRLAYDRWRIDILKAAFARIGASPPLVPFGMGYKEMSPAVDAMEQLAISGQLRHGGHPVLRWCISNTFIERDSAGNRKPTKARSWGRIDLAVACCEAIGAMKCSGTPEIDVRAMIG